MSRLLMEPSAAALLPEPARHALIPLVGAASSPRGVLAWVQEDIERPFAILDALDRRAVERGLACVFTFDALDRAANRWELITLAAGALLSLALDISRRSRAVRLKVFLRPDLESDAAKDFPDASKLRGHREELL